MAYVNERYVYIIGGFDLCGFNRNGEYLDDIEYFDINDFNKGWTIIKFNNNMGYNMKLTALGVIPISKNIFLICGGYDGKVYKNNTYRIDFTNHEYPNIEEEEELKLGKNIFTNNAFCKIIKSYFNFDFFGQLNAFDYENWQFRKIIMK